MFLLNGQQINIDNTFTTQEGVTYPNLRDPAIREGLGIVEVTQSARPDDRFYWVGESADGSYSSTPKDLEGLKADWVKQVKQTAFTLLAPSDYKVVRSVETGQAMDADTVGFRTAVRTKSNELETAINAAETVEALIEVVTTQGWPSQESAPVAASEPVEETQ